MDHKICINVEYFFEMDVKEISEDGKQFMGKYGMKFSTERVESGVKQKKVSEEIQMRMRRKRANYV